MKKVIANLNKISHDEWLQLRKQGLGGSDAAAAIGMSKWKSPLALYNEKISPEVVNIDNEAMYWGRVMEPILRKEFATRTGFEVVEVPYMLQSVEHPFMLADVDGCVTEPDGTKCILEIKTASGRSEKDWEDGMPATYYCQVQHYLSVCELSKAWVAVLIGGNKFEYMPIERDQDTIDMLISMEADFWQHVTDRIPPMIEANSSDAINAMYPQSRNTRMILPPEADQYIKDYNNASLIEAEVKQEKLAAENKIKALMKDAECAQGSNGWAISWKSYSTKRLDTAGLKAKYPKIYDEFLFAGSARRFTVFQNKK